MKRLLLGGALGALGMYFLDRDAGRRRRARVLDQLSHAARIAGRASRVTALDAAHRAQGLVADARRVLGGAPPAGDGTLVERVRAALGRVVSHPHAIRASVDQGHVDLSGPILADEVRALLKCVRDVPGVRGVSDHLTVYAEREHVSSLQGGVPRRGARFELMQDSWSPAARLLTASLGGAFMLRSLSERGVFGLALGAAGGALFARAVANRGLGELFGFANPWISVQKSIRVAASVEEVFAFWTDYQNFPRFMSKVKEVQPVSEAASRWVVAGPAGVPVHWTAEVTALEPRSRISWRATAGSLVRHEGSVRFLPDGAGGTRLTVELRYTPPAGAFGHAVAALFGADPKSEMDADLLRMKTMIETGRAPRDAARRVVKES